MTNTYTITATTDKTLETIIESLLLVPSIAEAIATGCYTEDQARVEFTEQILSCDFSDGLAYVEDIPELLRQDMLQVAG